MNSRLARHPRIARLRSQRALVPDHEAMDVLDEVAGSGLVEEIERLVARGTGSPCTLPVEALLVGMCLTAARNGGVILFTAVTDLLYFTLSDEMRQQLGLRRYSDHDRGFEAAYAVASIASSVRSTRPRCPRTTGWPAATPRSCWRRPTQPSWLASARSCSAWPT
ncbi:hypothetical protein ABZX40_17215 [Streptomyces sp. NPDC004610]|uniref:hypothetical protein n=1 Tax=unclassified Streptomyces TaxID=2593676 RepID=UPI0033B3BEFF